MIIAPHSAAQPERHVDAFLAGYVSAVLEAELGIPREEYSVSVQNTDVVLTLVVADPDGFEDVERFQTRLEAVQGIGAVRVELVAREHDHDTVELTSTRAYRSVGISRAKRPFPTGEPFRPLIADPKQPRFQASLRKYDTTEGEFTGAAVAFGESFGLYRKSGSGVLDGAQLNISGAVFAQFDMDADSTDLVNADYVIGLPLHYRSGRDSYRLRLYHQSSHLGDEFLLRNNPERINLSYESLEFLAAHEFNRFRVYGGGEYLLNREPDDLEPAALHAGLEFRGSERLWGVGRFLAGLDVKSWEEHDWEVDWSLKAGFEFGESYSGERRLRLLFEGYSGFSPHGQFFDQRLRYAGLGIYFGF